MKKCKRCGSVLPLSEFHKATKSPDGHQYVCKSCKSQIARESRQAKKAKEELSETLVGTVDSESQGVALSLDRVTSRDLLRELKNRGYVWTNMYVNIPRKVEYDNI